MFCAADLRTGGRYNSVGIAVRYSFRINVQGDMVGYMTKCGSVYCLPIVAPSAVKYFEEFGTVLKNVFADFGKTCGKQDFSELWHLGKCAVADFGYTV